MSNKSVNFLIILKSWLPLAIVLTLVYGLVCAAVQQNYRQSGNDPQIQMAEDFATTLSGGQSVDSLGKPPSLVDAAKSLSSFLIIFDDGGKPLVSSVQLDGVTPVPPAGVFDYVRKHGQDRVTWQPKRGVRIAAVVTRYTGDKPGFVLAGRSLREIEKRASNILLITGFAWAVSLLATLIAVIALEVLQRRMTPGIKVS